MKRFLLTSLILLFTASPALAQESESVYDRIIRTGTIRCGYLPYEPFISEDLNTGKLSGLTVEYLEAIVKKKGLKIDWAEEINIDQLIPALDHNRIDLVCVPATPDKNWAKLAEFGGNLGALPYFVYVPKDSSMTEEELNTAHFATVDGFALTEITHDAFPKATYSSLPQTTSTADMYNQLKYKKMDAHINEAISAMNYMENNPGVVRKFSETPVIATKMFLLSRKGDQKMATFVQESFDTDKPENLAIMKTLLKKYNIPEGALLLGDECKKSVKTAKGWRICDVSGGKEN